MIALVQASGPFGVLVVFLMLLNLGLVLWIGKRMFLDGSENAPDTERKINALLFWGAVGAGLGVLGQLSGTYLALNTIASATSISPSIVAEGMAIALVPTLMGILLLLASALAWAALRSLNRRFTATRG